MDQTKKPLIDKATLTMTTATATETTSTTRTHLGDPSPGKKALTERQLGVMLNSADFEESWKHLPTSTAEIATLYSSVDTVGSADFWKSKDLAFLLTSQDSVKMPPLPPLPSLQANERFRSIDNAVGLMRTNPTVPQSLMAHLMSKDSIFASKDSVFASIDPLPFKSIDSVLSNPNVDAKMPDAPPSRFYESREWVPLYEGSHQEIPCSQDMFRTSETATLETKPKTKSSKCWDIYRHALEVPSVPTVVTPEVKPVPTTRKPGKRGEPKEKIYVEPTSLDIISGRGGKSNSWPGNENYRAAIEEAKPAYREGAKYEKTIMSQEIVEKMMSEGRRFLKLENSGPHQGEYYLMTKNQARKKAGQALREENTPESRKKKREFYAKRNQ